MLRRLVAGALFFAIQTAAVPRQITGTIEGIVLRWGTNEPIGDADVELARIEGTASYPLGPLTYPPGDFSPGAIVRPTYPNPTDLRHARTKNDGRFSFTNLSPGVYRLLAARSGGMYHPAEYGQRHPRGNGYNFQLNEGQTMRDMRVDMALTGSISGRITNPDGMPAARALVMALEASYQSGRRVLGLVQSAISDDRGEYRLFYLPPGTYFVGARLEDPRKRTISFRRFGQDAGRETLAEAPIVFRATDTGVAVEETFVTVYYGGETDPASAKRITVSPGSAANGADILLNNGQPRAFRIRGTVVDAAGQPAPNATVRAVPTTWSPSLVAPGATTDNNGNFEIPGVAPGSYFVQVRISATMNAVAPFVVGERNVEALRLIASPGVSTTGRIVLEGRSTSGTTPDISSLRVNLVSDNPMLISGTGSALTGNAFTISGLLPGDYRVSINPIFRFESAPPYTAPTVIPTTLSDLYVKSARIGGEDILERGLHLQSQSLREVEVVLGIDGGRLQGLVVDAQKQFVPNAVVVMIPAPTLRARTDLYKFTLSQPNGRFSIAGIAPGDYRVFAWPYVEQGIWYDPDFVRSVETQGQTIRVAGGQTETLELFLSAVPQ